ncbi:unnamed protein product [Protopolystoma xenopodis]|uniref:WD repeat-containing protein 37 n=1 Tax=Protopolystoma xenopodis TaxID=117903 RepID=A0A448WYN7_9PLAT|nr:unnamed protein product [Protopolystoma xenopodis]
MDKLFNYLQHLYYLAGNPGNLAPAPIYLRHPHFVFQSANLGPSDTFTRSFVASSSSMPSGGQSESGCLGATASGGLMESSPLVAADFLSSRDQLVTAGWDRLGRIYDLATGCELDSLSGHDHQLTDVRASLASPVVATSARDCTFRVWDFRKPGMQVHIQQAHSQPLSTAQFLPGGPTERIVSAGFDRQCRIWDLRNSRGPLVTIRTDSGINRLSISRGAPVASAGFQLPQGGVTGIWDPHGVSSLGFHQSTMASSQTSAMASNAGITAVTLTGSHLFGNTFPGDIGAANVPTLIGGCNSIGQNFPAPASVPLVDYSQPVSSLAGSGTSTTMQSPVELTGYINHLESGGALLSRPTGFALPGGLLALPLDDRSIKIFHLNGARIGRLPRGTSQVSPFYCIYCTGKIASTSNIFFSYIFNL